MAVSWVLPFPRPLVALVAVLLGLCASGCFHGAEEPPPGGPPPMPEGGPPPMPEASPPPMPEASPPPAGEIPGAAQNPDKPPHQLCTADLDDFLTHGVKVADLEAKIDLGIELGVTSLPLLATPEELVQLRERGIPQELLDKWTSTTAGTLGVAPVGAEPVATPTGPQAPAGATP